MEKSFWHQRWEEMAIPFHEKEANPALVQYFKALSLIKGSRVFVPLCGKSLDMRWLLSNGYRVAGAELSEKAVGQFFEELGVKPKISGEGELEHYSAPNIDIFAGDILDLSSPTLGPVDAIYDRAALVALPKEMRDRYTAHLIKITDAAPQLLIGYDYDQSLMEGPPFSISSEKIHQHYGDRYRLTLLSSTNVLGGLKGKCAAIENVWLLIDRNV
jgi:thiopurine S-methyltransferase